MPMDYKTLQTDGFSTMQKDEPTAASPVPASHQGLDESIREMEEELKAMAMEERALSLGLELKKKRERLRQLREVTSPVRDVGELRVLAESTPKASLPRIDLNPQIYLTNPTRKYKAITSYVPRLSTRQEEEIVIGEDVVLTKKSGAKLKLENVTPANWVSANALIMSELVSELIAAEHPPQSLHEFVLDYCSYTTKIGELANRFTWASVMAYDDDYRARQSQFGFRWGSDSPHLATVSLEERVTKKHTTATNKSGTKSYKKGGKKPCVYFNEGRCFHGESCTYAHVCTKCGDSHPEKEHDKVGDKGPGKRD